MAHAILPVAQHINKRDIRRNEIKLGKLINSDPTIFVVVVHVDDATCPLRSISHQFNGNMRVVVDIGSKIVPDGHVYFELLLEFKGQASLRCLSEFNFATRKLSLTGSL